MVDRNGKAKVPGIYADFLPPLDDQMYYSILEKSKHIKEVLNCNDGVIINMLDGEKKEKTPSNSKNKKASSRQPIIGKCSICGLVVQHPSRIKEHSQTHTKVKPFECDICNEKFSRKCSLNLHIKRKHKESDDYHCTWECGKSFPSVGLLNEHVRYHHSGMRRYKCTVLNCGSLFVRRQQFLKHLKNVHNVVNVT
uniref:C2H2-type domain-containing protein n=1 Tax=Strongyloides stercoralis TaxID=6248 RepID=A0A0K0EDX3_STRER